MSEWKEFFLNDVYTISSGLSKPAEDFGSGFPFLSFKEVFNNFFVPKKLSELVESSEKERLTCSIKRGDVFLTRTSETVNELGMSCVALEDHENATFNGFTKRLRPKGNIEIVPEYAGYYFRNTKFRKEITSMSSASTRASLNIEMIGRLKIILPSKAEQSSIGFILKTLDDKIDNLRRQNETLEAIAQTLFKHWFIDFEFPNADGKPYKSSGGAMIPSELGEIPEGWRVGVSGEIINLQGGFAFKSDDFQDTGNHGVIKIRNISDNIVDINKTDFISDSVASKTSIKFKLSSGDILIAMTGAEVAKIGVVPKTRNSFFLNQRVGLFQEKINGGKLYIYYLFSREEYQKALRDRGSGSSAQPNISASDIEDITIIIPKLIILEKFANIAGSLFIKRCENLFQIQTLNKTRDILLPKLMSGQIRVKE